MDEDMEQEQSLASMIGVLQGDMGATIEVPPPGSEKVGFLNLTCKALNLMRFSPSANTEFGFSLQKAFQTNDLFMDSETGLVGSMEMVTPTNSTYRFNIILRLQEDLVVN